MPPPQSNAWSYFKGDVESTIVKCKLCNLEMTYTGGTSNMLNHLKLKHSSDISGWFTPLLYFVKEPYYLELGYSLNLKNPLFSTSFNDI
jgi:hypothetical protein